MKQIVFFIFFSSSLALSQDMLREEPLVLKVYSSDHSKAYTVLQTKCNVCHRTQNPSKVFTPNNMNGFAKKIKRQVFFWKRMPKGNSYKLTTEEKKVLKNWIKKQN